MLVRIQLKFRSLGVFVRLRKLSLQFGLKHLYLVNISVQYIQSYTKKYPLSYYHHHWGNCSSNTVGPFKKSLQIHYFQNGDLTPFLN